MPNKKTKHQKFKPWFHEKKHGISVMPSSWEGWIFTSVLIGVLFISAYALNFLQFPGPTQGQTLIFMGVVFLVVFVFLCVVRRRVEKDHGWHWGKTLMKKKKLFK